MKLELRNIKINKQLSEETHCYSATLYADGKAVAQVGNRGHGGPDECYALEGKAEALNAAIAYCKTLPPVPSEYFPDGLPMTLELFCGFEIDAHLMAADMKRLMKSKVLYREPGQPLMSCSFKGVRTLTPQHLAAFRAKNPKAEILNDMPEAEALAIFKAAT